MLSRKFTLALSTACGLALALAAAPSHGHFLWLKTVEQENRPHAFLFFGENTADEAYHLPESLADAKVWVRSGKSERTQLTVKPWEGEDRIGLGSPLPDGLARVLEASEQYGVYGTALLTYWAKHLHATSTEQFNEVGVSKEMKLDIVPQAEGDELKLTVLWEGKPIAGAEVSVAVGDGEAIKIKTDEEGHVTLKPEGAGLIGVLANRTETNVSGTLDGKPYDHALHYASLTFDWPVAAKEQVSSSLPTKPQVAVPPLPEPVSSFGAVVVDGWLYVYGGHVGTEHDHSAANLSNHFRRIQIDGGQAWQELPMQTPLQGLPLVTHDRKVYRVGGLNARNLTAEDEEVLHSTAEFAEFDPKTGQWTLLEPLPAPRSSHNATVIGNRMYVVGGWQLAGTSPGNWQPDALVYDFAEPQRGWQKLPAPPFTRRALAASHWKGKLVALGGMDEQAKISRRVDVLDLETGTWTAGPELPGEGMEGFGISACDLDGGLYVSGLRQKVLRLSDSGLAWEEAARAMTARFFHQLVPVDNGSLLAIAGASRNEHLADIEWISVGSTDGERRTATSAELSDF